MKALGLLVALLLCLVAADPAAAAGIGQGAVNNWKAMDRCAKQAQTLFPDHTPEGNAKRDAALNACLSAGNLPPRAPLSPPANR